MYRQNYGKKYTFRPQRIKTINPWKRQDYDIWSPPGPMPPITDPLLKKYEQEAIALKQRLEEKNVDRRTIIKEMRKLRDQFYKELVKKYPKEKQNLNKLYKELSEFSDIKLRLQELLDASKERKLTKKELQELEEIPRKIERLERYRK